MALNITDLPTPEGPLIPIISPAFNCIDKLNSNSGKIGWTVRPSIFKLSILMIFPG